MADHTLSIVIPSHSRPDLLKLCLQTVTHHAPTGTEIIVVDDGSRRECVLDTASEFTHVKVIRHTTALGFCSAANAGILAASGTIIELLNDDTEVTAGWADAALDCFKNQNVVAVAPLVLMHSTSPPRIDSAGDNYDTGGFASKRFHNRLLASTPLRRCSVDGVSASAGFYRRNALMKAGLFPTEFGAYFEDVDLSQRLRKLGAILHEPASVVWHRVSASYGRTPSRQLLEQQSRNEERLFWRHSQPRDVPRHIAVLAGKLLRRIEEGTAGPWLAGRLRAATMAFRW